MLLHIGTIFYIHTYNHIGKNSETAIITRDVNDLPEIQRAGRDLRCLENLIDPKHTNTFNDRYL